MCSPERAEEKNKDSSKKNSKQGKILHSICSRVHYLKKKTLNKNSVHEKTT